MGIRIKSGVFIGNRNRLNEWMNSVVSLYMYTCNQAIALVDYVCVLFIMW